MDRFTSSARRGRATRSVAPTIGAATGLWVSCAMSASAMGADAGAEDTVVITATRTERQLGDVPASVSVIGAESIAETPGLALDDILRRSPSVDLPSAASYQVHPTANSVSMRGLGGIRALVLLDGVPINDPFFGYMQWSRVPLELVDQVEVVRGGGATLWGNYAMGGVVNVRTRQPTENQLVLQGGGGSYGTYRAHAFGSYVPSDDARFALSAGRAHTDGFMQIGPDVRGTVNVPTSYTSNNAALRTGYDFSSTLKATARVDYFDNDQSLQTRLSHNSQRTWNYSGTLDQSVGSDGAVALTLFGSHSDFETENTGGFDGVPENDAEFVQNVHHTPVQDVGTSLVWSQSASMGWLRSYSLGVDFHRISGKDVASIYDETGALVRTDLGRGKQRFWGGFVQASIRPVDPLEILASVRYQSFENLDAFDGTPGGLGAAPDSSETSVDPRISARYALTSVFALRGAYYTAFRAPNLDNLYRAFSVPFGIFYANPELVPETLTGGEIGFDIETAHVRLQATAYDNTIEHLITSRNLEFSELPDGFFFGSRNINAGRARSRGVELETQWKIAEGFDARFSYTHADSKITSNDLDPASVDKQIGGVPRNRACIAFSYQGPRGLRVTPQLRWVQASFADNAHTLPVDAQHLVDLAASYPITAAVQGFVQIENLFNSHYVADNSGFNPPLRGTPFSAFVGFRAELR